jgi:hypothetical protein
MPAIEATTSDLAVIRDILNRCPLEQKEKTTQLINVLLE